MQVAAVCRLAWSAPGSRRAPCKPQTASPHASDPSLPTSAGVQHRETKLTRRCAPAPCLVELPARPTELQSPSEAAPLPGYVPRVPQQAEWRMAAGNRQELHAASTQLQAWLAGPPGSASLFRVQLALIRVWLSRDNEQPYLAAREGPTTVLQLDKHGGIPDNHLCGPGVMCTFCRRGGLVGAYSLPCFWAHTLASHPQPPD